jgi:EmrB/QacA subfamily drug resistance transporter
MSAAAPDATQQSDNDKGMWLALVGIVLGTFVSILNSSLMNVALPKFVAVFGSSVNTIQWVITGYMLASAIVIPMSGYLGARFGAKNIFLMSVAGFTLGSVLCGLAWSDTSLILFRIIQGMAGGFIMPIGMSIIYMTFPVEKRSTAMGMWGIASMVAPALGPTLGGYIVQYYSWRLLFFINIPVGVVAVIIGYVLLKDSPRRQGLKFDLPGAVLSIIFFGSVLLALTKGQSEGWTSLYIVSLLFVAFFSLLLLIWVELGTEQPLLDLKLFKNPIFSLGTLASSLVMMGMLGGTFLVPLYLQNIQALSPIQTGLLLIPQSIVMALMMPISGKLFDKLGVIPLGVVGLSILGVTTLELHHLTADTPLGWLNVVMSIRAFGIGLCMMPLTQVGMNAIPVQQIGNASPLSNVSRQVAGSMGIAILTTIMSSRQIVHTQYISDSVPIDSMTATQMMSLLSGSIMQSGVDSATSAGAAASFLFGIMQKEALVRAIADTFYISAIPALLCIPLVLFLRTKKPAAAPPQKAEPVQSSAAAAAAAPAKP